MYPKREWRNSKLVQVLPGVGREVRNSLSLQLGGLYHLQAYICVYIYISARFSLATVRAHYLFWRSIALDLDLGKEIIIHHSISRSRGCAIVSSGVVPNLRDREEAEHGPISKVRVLKGPVADPSA